MLSKYSAYGNPVLVNAALSAIYSLNIRPAEGGEFSKRAKAFIKEDFPTFGFPAITISNPRLAFL